MLHIKLSAAALLLLCMSTSHAVRNDGADYRSSASSSHKSPTTPPSLQHMAGRVVLAGMGVGTAFEAYKSAEQAGKKLNERKWNDATSHCANCVNMSVISVCCLGTAALHDHKL